MRTITAANPRRKRRETPSAGGQINQPAKFLFNSRLPGQIPLTGILQLVAMMSQWRRIYLRRCPILKSGLVEKMNRKLSIFLSAACLAALAHAANPGTGHARAANSGIDALLIENVPVPTRRPHFAAQGGVPIHPAQPAARETAAAILPVETGRRAQVAPMGGNLENGLKALGDKDAMKALAIGAAMPAGSLDRKILIWSIALSGLQAIPSGEIAAAAGELPGWPGQETMRRHAEEAMARENHSAKAVIAAFAGRRPETADGALLLARAWLDQGDIRKANAAIAPIWHRERLSASAEKKILASVGRALSVDDHRVRMHMQFYRERAKDGMRMGALAEQYSLARARAAVIGNDKKADALLDAVKSPSDRDTAYLYSRIKRARRLGNYKEAARLMMKAPADPSLLVDADEWWIERRLIARAMLDAGDPRTAYEIAAGYRADSPAQRAEAEFHAGWFALSYLNEPRTARRHFENLRRDTSTPISQARAHYWIGRTLSGEEAATHYRAAAQYQGTFYGQLAAQKIGRARLDIRQPQPTPADRSRFARRELVRAIERLEGIGQGWRAEAIYRELARTLDSPGEIAILAARAERHGKHHLALQLGKTGYWRGLAVETVAWPIGAIPGSASLHDAGLALAYAVARQESAFNAGAISPARARGLLQLMPGTAKLMARKLGVRYSSNKLTADPGYNATLGAAYLSEQLDNFSNSYILTFAGYNAGPNRVKHWISEYGDPRSLQVEAVIDWIERIPFTETRNYVQRVMENYQVYKARLGGSQLDIEADLRHGRR